ncbi:MAG TPA: integrase, partial [Eubacteriaceae bacterium]|nr:integrase [Eubacteriaceae bacterium]
QYVTYTNSNTGKARKLATIRSFYRYFYKKEMLENNPALLVELPKITEKPITRLEVDEVVKLLDLVENADQLT